MRDGSTDGAKNKRIVVWMQGRTAARTRGTKSQARGKGSWRNALWRWSKDFEKKVVRERELPRGAIAAVLIRIQ